MENDLTLLYIHADKLSDKWVAFHREQLNKLPYLLIDLYDEKKISYQRIYDQLLIGCKQATTKYIAVIEDDTLYPPEHFSRFRPKDDEFSYDQHRWALIDYKEPMYSWRNRVSNCSLIANREFTIRVLEERNEICPNGWKYVGELGRWRIDEKNGFKPHKLVEWYSTVGIIQMNHNYGTEDRQRINRKDHGPVRAYDIPCWGKASEILNKFK